MNCGSTMPEWLGGSCIELMRMLSWSWKSSAKRADQHLDRSSMRLRKDWGITTMR